jgi:anti-sigma factor (TIGR02949 family)
MSFFDRLKRLLGGSETSEEHSGGNGKGPVPRDHISCMEAMERLQEYLDGELDDISHEEVAHHFEVCQKCFPHLKLEERFRTLLRRSQEDEACPDHVRQQVLDLLSTEADDPD